MGARRSRLGVPRGPPGPEPFDLVQDPVRHDRNEFFASRVAFEQVEHRVERRHMPGALRQPELGRIGDLVFPHSVGVAAVDGHWLRQHGDLATDGMPNVQVPVQRHDISGNVVVTLEAAVHHRVGLDEIHQDESINAQIAAQVDRGNVESFAWPSSQTTRTG